jgi:hypothetical protein
MRAGRHFLQYFPNFALVIFHTGEDLAAAPAAVWE